MALLQAEGRVTLVDGILATAVLVALTLKAVIGWWWADPLPGMCSSSAPPGRHVRSSPALTNAINKMANAARPAADLRTCTGRTTRNRAEYEHGWSRPCRPLMCTDRSLFERLQLQFPRRRAPQGLCRKGSSYRTATSWMRWSASSAGLLALLPMAVAAAAGPSAA